MTNEQTQPVIQTPTQGTQEYDANLNKELQIPIGGSTEQGIIKNLSTTNLSSGTISAKQIYSKDGSIQMFGDTNKLQIYIGF